MQKYGRCTALKDFSYILLSYLGLTIHYYFVTLDGNNLASLLIYEVLIPALEHTCGKFFANSILKVLLVYLYLLGKVEYSEYILVTLKTDGT